MKMVLDQQLSLSNYSVRVACQVLYQGLVG